MDKQPPIDTLGYAIIAAGILFQLFVGLYIYGQMAKRAGFSRAWGLLMGVPILNMFVPMIFAFSAWPAERSGSKTRKRRKNAK